jgi:hypothetical protein
MKSAHRASQSRAGFLLGLMGILITVECRSVQVPGENGRKSSVKKEIAASIFRSERRMADAWQKHDVAVAGRLFADDYKSIPVSGRGLTKSEILDEVARSEQTKTDVFEPEVRIVSPDVAMYTARIVDYGVTEGPLHPFRLTTHVLDIWVLRRGAWQLVADQTIYLKGVLDENVDAPRGIPI